MGKVPKVWLQKPQKVRQQPIEQVITSDSSCYDLVQWYALIRDAEVFTNATGWGLAIVWAAIQRRNYASARAQMDLVMETYDYEGHP